MLPLIPNVKEDSPSVKHVFSLNHGDRDLYSLNHYKKLAIKHIHINAGPFSRMLINDEDAVSYVMYKLMVGTCHWNYKWKHVYIREKYLWYFGRYAVIKLIKLYGGNRLSSILSLDNKSLLNMVPGDDSTNVDNNNYDIESYLLNIIKGHKSLSKKQREYLLYMCDGFTQTEIANKFNVTRQAVNDCVKRGKEKISRETTL